MRGSVGASARSSGGPGTVPVNVRVAKLTYTLAVGSAPELARSGVLKYSYAGTVNRSMYSPAASVSRSYAVIDANASEGSISVSLIAEQSYTARCASSAAPSHSPGVYTVVPTHAHPAAKHAIRPLTLSPDSLHTRQLDALAHERSSVARSVTDCSHARFTCAKRPLTKPLSVAFCGT